MELVSSLYMAQT